MTDRQTSQDVSYDDLANWFTHHPPKDKITAETYGVIRDAGHEFAKEVVAFVPAGVERDEAIKAIRNAVMWANAGVACNPSGTGPQPLVDVLADQQVQAFAGEQFPVLGCGECRSMVLHMHDLDDLAVSRINEHVGRVHGWWSQQALDEHGITAWVEEHR